MKSTGQNAAPGQNVPRDSDTADAEASDRRHLPDEDERETLDGNETIERSPPPAQIPRTKRETQGQLDAGLPDTASRS